MRPLRDQASQLLPLRLLASRRRTRTTRAVSSMSTDLGTLHTRTSPSRVCVASMSDFCRDEDACHASVTIGDGDSDVVVSVCRIVNAGESAATRIDPLA